MSCLLSYLSSRSLCLGGVSKLMFDQLTQIEPHYQPVTMPDETAEFSPDVEAEIDRHIAKYPVVRSVILSLMFIVQRERGYVDPPAVNYRAKRCSLRLRDVWEVATFD